MSKRKNGEGSWGTKSFKGVEYQYYRDANGKYTYAKTLKELRQKLNSKSQGKMTSRDDFQSYALNYTKNFIKPHVSAKTFDTYEYFINSSIDDITIAHMQIASITSYHWQLFVNELANKYSISTIRSLWQLVKQVVKYAEINGDIPLNTLYGVKLPKPSACHSPTKQVPFITESDMDILWEESFRKHKKTNTPVYGDGALIIDFIMYTGLRISEACALKYRDINTAAKELTVRSTLSRVIARDSKGNPIAKKNGAKKQIILDKEPKTPTSVRVIPLCKRALEIIDIVLEKFPNKQPDDYFFENRNGTHYSSDAVSYTLNIMQRNSNLSRKDYSPHSLRHGFGSILISKGADIKLVSELLGHTNVSFTYNVYIGIYGDDKRKAIDLLD